LYKIPHYFYRSPHYSKKSPHYLYKSSLLTIIDVVFFFIVQISENGLEARVRTLSVGLGKVTATLRSTLSPQHEETQIVPQVKVRFLHLLVGLENNSVSKRKIAEEENKCRRYIADHISAKK
jgi:hypothetical protein